MKQNSLTAKDDEDIQYCDTNVLAAFDADGKSKDQVEDKNLNFVPYEKKDSNIDLMDFISKSDFTTVGGRDNSIY